MQNDPTDHGDDFAALGRPGRTIWDKYALALFGGPAGLLAALVSIWMGYDQYHGYHDGYLAFGVAGAVATYLGLRNQLAESKLGGVDVTWEPLDFSPDGPFTTRVRFAPETSGTLDGCHLTLTAFYFKKVRIQGKDRKKRVDAWSAETRLPPEGHREFDAGDLVDLSHTFHVPAATEILKGGNSYSWELTVHLDIPRFPDWSQTFSIA